MSDQDQNLAPGELDLDFDAMFSEVQSQVEQDSSGLKRLKSWSTLRRVSLTLGIVLVTLAGITLFSARPDLEVYPLPRMLVTVAIFVALVAASIWAALRPLSQANLPLHKDSFFVVASIIAVVTLATLPAAHLDHPASQGAVGPELWPKAAACLYYGTITGIPVYIALRLFDRGGRHFSAFLAAAAAGVAGNSFLQMHCAYTEPTHLLTSHAPVVLVFLVLSLLTRKFGR